jgi:hypothetical protein
MSLTSDTAIPVRHSPAPLDPEIFVSCVGDLATVGGSVVVVTRSFLPLVPSFLFARPRVYEVFTLAVSLCSGLAVPVEVGCQDDARGERSLSGCLGGSVSELPVYSLHFTVYCLLISVYGLLFVLI